MRHLLTVISIVLASSLGPAIAQNKSTPKPEAAEKNAFETPPLGRAQRILSRTLRISPATEIPRAG